jgi:membrane protein required for beta-lactamase induction
MDALKVELMALLLAVLVAGIRFVSQWMKARFKPAQLQAVAGLAQQAVRAAEQFGVDFDDIKGAEKFEFAKQAIMDGAAKVGVKLTDQELMSFIQAALADVRNEFAWTRASVPEAA